MRGSLFFKLTGGFALVVLVTLAGVTLFANWVIGAEFQRLLVRGRIQETQDLSSALADYYEEQGGWEGVGRLLSRRGLVRLRWMAGGRIILAQPDGSVLFDSWQRTERVKEEQLARGLPIQPKGQTVAFLITEGPGERIGMVERSFLRRVNLSVILAGVLGVVIALLLGGLLFVQITRPLGRLRDAARKLAQGELCQRVEVDSGDEIGELAQAFNEMAGSLQRVEELRKNMVADIAHELRTPLAVIRGHLEALQDGVFAPTEENIGVIHEETLLLARLVDDLRDLALADAGQLEIERGPVDLAALISKVVTGVRTRASEKDVLLVEEVPERLPEVRADAQRIAQVVSNLLSNGITYTPSGGKVTVAAKEVDGWVEVRVADTGPGIPPEEMPYLFERFYRSDRSRSRAQGGSGLGLAIAKQLVEAHGGRIWAESEVGRGAIFVFTLPCHDR
jgi:two-component system OmpR family sensor kinase/two-component system sensor histidine kinase BaeS